MSVHPAALHKLNEAHQKAEKERYEREKILNDLAQSIWAHPEKAQKAVINKLRDDSLLGFHVLGYAAFVPELFGELRGYSFLVWESPERIAARLSATGYGYALLTYLETRAKQEELAAELRNVRNKVHRF